MTLRNQYNQCGSFVTNQPQCTRKIGRPRDVDMDFCDSWCCRQGFLTGYDFSVSKAQNDQQIPKYLFVNL